MTINSIPNWLFILMLVFSPVVLAVFGFLIGCGLIVAAVSFLFGAQEGV